MLRFDDFLVFAKSAHIVIADYESRLGRLQAMVEIFKTEPDPLLRKWIAVANERLTALKPLYDAAQATSTLPVAEIEIIHLKIRELEDGC